MNWSLIIFGLVALSSVTFATNSYLVIIPNLLKVGYDNQISVFIAAAPQPVEVQFALTIGNKHLEWKTMCKPGETRNVTLTLPKEFPVGAGELIITGTGGLRFEEKRDMIIYDNRHIMMVQTSASTYRPRDTMEIRVVCMNEHFMPMESGELIVEIYDAALKLVGEFPHIPIRFGLTETMRYTFADHLNVGAWLVSATIANTTSSVEVLVSHPITPSFDLKAIFQRFLLRTDKMLRGVIEIANDNNEPIFGRGMIAIGQMTEQDVEMMKMSMDSKEESWKNEEWRKWKSQPFEMAGRIELNYDLLSLFNVDISKCLALQIYIQVTELPSGQERIIRHMIPVFTRDIIYDIRPLEFQAGVKNEFEIIAKRPDGKPVKMEDMMVTVQMILGNEEGKKHDEKSVEIKDFYTRGRNDMGFFNVEIPDNCIGVLMTITPFDETGKVRGYRTHAIPLMPTPRRHDWKLTMELLPSTVAPAHTNVNVPVVSSQISTVGRTSNFYIQLLPSKSIDKFEQLPMSYVLMTNGRITLTGEFYIQPTKECQTKTVRTIRPEEQTPPTCMFNGTLPIEITRDMMPYSTLLVYSFQPTFGINVAESYRFSVAGLFQNPLMLNATMIPFTSSEMMMEPMYMKEMNMKPIHISPKVQDKTRIELSFTGVPDSTVGLNVFEYDGVLQGLSNEITKERLLKYLTTYEQVPFMNMPTMSEPMMMDKHRKRHTTEDRDTMEETTPFMKGSEEDDMKKSERTMSEQDEEELINRERMGYQVRYPIEKMIFGVSSSRSLPTIEGDDIYTTSNMGRLYGDLDYTPSTSHYRRKFEKSVNQYDVTVGNNDYVVATSMPLVFTGESSTKPMPSSFSRHFDDVEVNEEKEPLYERSSEYGTGLWYEKMHNKLKSFSQEAFTFMHSGLSIVSDFDSLRIPVEMKHKNFTKLFSKFRQELFMNKPSFSIRDEARQLLEEYISQSDLSMMPPPIMFEEQARMGYYRSIFFNTSRIESQGTGKVVLPRTKPYSTWLATGFSLNMKSGLSIAQPIRLPTNQGLYVLANCPKQVQMGERVLLTYGINNYLGKDLTNVVFRIRASNDFDLMEQTKPEQIVSSIDKDYTFNMPSFKSFGVETRHMIFVPKRTGIIHIVMEVESEFGGDYEILTVYVHESGIERKQLTARLFDLTSEKKTYGPFIEKINQSPALRSIHFSVSGTGVDRLIKRYTMETNALIGIDRSIVRLYRALGLRRYLNETFQMDSPLFDMSTDNITTAYQRLQLYSDYDGSYSFISDEGTEHSSLYLTSFAFGAMISPMMPFRDNVTLNRTLNWILSHQKEDGSFDDEGPCFHYRFCSGEFRRESLTAIVLYSLTRDNASYYMPEFIYQRLYKGENSPIMRAQRYLESRVPDVKPHMLTLSLFEMAFIQNKELSPVLREKIHQALLSRKLTVVPEDGSKYIKNMDDSMTFDDQLLLNAMTVSLYASFEDYRTATDIARWVVTQIQIHPHYDTVLDAVFRTEAWLKIDCLFRKQFDIEKFGVTVDMTADNGEKQQFKIDSKNLDVTQTFRFTLPVRQITYSVNGFGLVILRMEQLFAETQQQQKTVPFQLMQEFTPMPWISEIKAKTCMTYTPTTADQKFVTSNFNRTMVVEVELPSGTRINMRQIGFLLSRIENVMYFTYEPCGNKLFFFLNVPSTMFNKPICLEWCLERLSTIVSWSPVTVRTYDYLQQETQLVQLIPIEFQPKLMGYSYVEAVQKARPSLETMTKFQKPMKV